MKNVLLTLTFAMSLSAGATEAGKDFKIKWVLAHEPIGLFKEAAEIFTKEVTAKTKGHLQVEVLTLPEYEAKYNAKNKIPYGKFVSKIQNGDIEMSQTYTTDLGSLSKELYVLDLPFLFRDHDHAKKVLEGNVGDKLLTSLVPSNIRGLAFTYSGGYRIIPGVKKITKVEDFKGLKVRTSSSPVAMETFNILGAEAVPMGLNKIEENMKAGKINEAESTYARYFTLGQNHVAKIVNETNHSLFLTSIVVNDKFWNSLPEEYKTIMKEAAFNAARVERDHSVKAAVDTREQAKKAGIEIVQLDKKEEAKLKEALKPVYTKFAPMVGQQLITDIQAQ